MPHLKEKRFTAHSIDFDISPSKPEISMTSPHLGDPYSTAQCSAVSLWSSPSCGSALQRSQRTDHTGAVAFGGQVQRAAAVVTQLGLVLEADGWGPVGDGGCEDGYKQDLF